MATVLNKGNPATPIDKPLSSPNRSGSGDPNGSITPAFRGEIYLDTSNKKLWIAVGAANTDWVTYQLGN